MLCFKEICLQVSCMPVMMICAGMVVMRIIFLLKTGRKDTVVIKNNYICIQFTVPCILAA